MWLLIFWRFNFKTSTVYSSLSDIGNFYKKAQKDTEADLFDEMKKLTKQQETFCDK